MRRRHTWQRIALVAEPGAVPTARRWLAGHGAPVLGGKLEEAQLVLTELLTNGMRHGGSGVEAAVIEVRARADGDRLRVEVRDGGVSFAPPPRPLAVPPSHHEGGRGLLLVDRLCDRWGVEAEAPTRVWFETERPPEDAAAAG